VLLPRQYSVQIHNVPKFDEQIYVKTTAVKQVSCRKIVIAQWTSSKQLYQFSIALETMLWFYSFEEEKMSIQIFFLTEIQDHPIKCSEATTYEASYFWFQTKYETS